MTELRECPVKVVCPYCESEMKYCTTNSEAHWFRCSNDDCASEAPVGDTKEEAIKVASHRPTESRLREIIEEIPTMVDFLYEAWRDSDEPNGESAYEEAEVTLNKIKALTAGQEGE